MKSGVWAVGLIVLAGTGACAKTDPPRTSAVRSEGPAASVAPARLSASAAAILASIAEIAEDLFEDAKRGAWVRATPKLARLRSENVAFAREAARESTLDAAVAAVEKGITTKDKLAAMRGANELTRVTIGLTASPKATMPIEVAWLDYQGRALTIDAEANDLPAARAHAGDLAATWAKLRPVVEAHGGTGVAKDFGATVEALLAAKTVVEVGPLAKRALDQVDDLEKVFEH